MPCPGMLSMAILRGKPTKNHQGHQGDPSVGVEKVPPPLS